VDDIQVGIGIAVDSATTGCVLGGCVTELGCGDETLVGESFNLSGAQADKKKKTTSAREDRCLIFKETFFDMMVILGVVNAYS